MRFDPGVTDITQAELQYLLDEIGVSAGNAASTLAIQGTPQDLNSPLRVIDAGAIALAAQAIALASLAQKRAAAPERAAPEEISIDARQIVFSFKPFFYTLLEGRSTGSWANLAGAAPCMGHFKCADGRFVYMCSLVPKLRNATLRFLGCEPERDAVAKAIANWKSEELEAAMTAQGIPVAVVRDGDEWLKSDQGMALQSSPLVPVRRLSESAPVALEKADRPFAGLKVVDMTHVLAGPMLTRGLAEYGAEVLHLSSGNPEHDDPKPVSFEFRLGKKTATLDLNDPAQREMLTDLLRDADVFVHSWRPGVFERYGFSPEQIAALNPSIIQLAVSCYSTVGPWSARGGFDGLALASTGATALEALYGPPKVSPPGVVTDALVGVLGTAVVASLLQRRAEEGGSYRADLSLARIAMWLVGLGLDSVSPNHSEELGEPPLRRLETPVGTVDHVASPIGFSTIESQLPYAGALDRPEWG